MNPGIHAMRQMGAYSQTIYIRNLDKKAVVIQTTAKINFHIHSPYWPSVRPYFKFSHS